MAHQTNLLLKDLMKIESLSATMTNVVAIAAFVRSSIAFRAALCQYKGVKSIAMWIPTETHWYSIITTIGQVLELKQAMQVSTYFINT